MPKEKPPRPPARGRSSSAGPGESEARFRSLVKLSSDWYWEQDASFRYTSIIASEESADRTQREHFLGRAPWDIPGLEPDAGGWDDHKARLALRRPFRGFLQRWRQPGGTERYIATSGEPLLEESGKLLGYRGVGSDITARIIESRALARAHEGLALALDSSGVSIWETDLKTAEVILSEGWAELLGEPPGKTRTTIQALLALTHPDDLAHAVRLSMEAVRGDRSEYIEEHRVRTRSGQWRWVLSRGRVAERDASGRALRMIGTNVDITERKNTEQALAESEARFRSMFERHDAAMLLVDARSGRIADSNAAAARFYGYRQEQLSTMSIADLNQLPPGEIKSAIGDALVNKRNEFVFPHRLASGEMRWVEVHSTSIPYGGREMLFSIIHDVTDAKAARARIERMNLELEETVAQRTAELRSTVKDLDAFTYSVSHDLRTPLGAINGFAGMLRMKEAERLTDDGRKLLGFVESNAERMADLVEGLLTLSRIGRQAISRRRVVMQELVQDLVAEGPQVTTAEVSVGALPECEGDALLLRQVWANLIGNAFKYSRGRNPARIEIGFEDQARAYFVRDNGAGFDMRYADKLFGAFERLHSESEFEGTGVGLAIVERIVLRHGGRAWAKAAPDQGATFWFTVAE